MNYIGFGHTFRRFLQDDSGQALTSYAIILVFVVIVVIATVSVLGHHTVALYNNATLNNTLSKS